MKYIAFDGFCITGIHLLAITNAVDNYNLANIVVPAGVAYWLLSEDEVKAFEGIPQEEWIISRDVDGISTGTL